jgi:hypothetical protein
MPNFSQMFPGAQLPPILSGAMAGAQIPYAFAGADQDLQNSQIRNMSDLDKLQMMRESEDPMNRAKNSLEQAKAESSNDPNLIAALKAADLSKANASVMTDEGKKRQEQDEFLYGLSNDIIQKQKAGEKVYDPMNQESKDWWDDQVKDAKKRGIPLPAVPDMQPDGSSRTINMLVQKNASLADTIAQRNAMAKQKLVNEGQIAGHQISASAVESAAKTSAAAREQVATTNNAGRLAQVQAKNEILMGPTNAVLADLRAGRKVSPVLMEMAAEVMVDNEIKNGPLGTGYLLKIMEGDPQATAYKKAKVQEKVDKWSKGQVEDTSAAPTKTGYDEATTKRIQAVVDSNPGSSFADAVAALKKEGKIK